MSLQTIIDSGVRTALPFMEDRVTFKRSGTATVDSVGGSPAPTPANTTPVSIPTVIDVASANQRAMLGEKTIKGTLYALTIPAQYSSSVVDVDSKCDAVVAARGVNAERTFHVQGITRVAGAIITVLASKEE